MRKRYSKPTQLGEVLSHFLKKSGLNRKIQEQKILDVWEKAVGEAIAERTRPMEVKNRVLKVKINNTVWMQQLQFMKGLILQKIHEQTGDQFLRDIRFFIGEIEMPGREEKKEETREPKGEFKGLTPAERERIEKALLGLADPEMREILSRIYSKGMAAGKNRWSK